MKKIYFIGLIGLVGIGFSGCVTSGTVCKAPDNDTIRLEMYDRVLIKDRLQITSEAVYNVVENNDTVVVGDVSTQSQIFTWSGLFSTNLIVLDKNKKTARIGNNIYNCDDVFSTEIKKVTIRKEVLEEEKRRSNFISECARNKILNPKSEDDYSDTCKEQYKKSLK